MDSKFISPLSYDDDSFTSGCESDSTDTCVVKGSTEEIYAQQGRYDQGDAEDSKLRNWRKWLGNRKKEYGRLKSALNKDPLIMNSDNIFENRRNAKLIESAEKYIVFDKYRGDPKFWKTPEYMYDRNCERSPVNCSVQQHFDRTVVNENEPPAMEYIGVSLMVQNEKGLIESQTAQKKGITFHKCDYLSDRKKQLKHNVNSIEKYVPDTDNLYVIGRPYPLESSAKSSSIEDCSSDVTIVQHCVRRTGGIDEFSNADTRFPVLKIQGNVIDKNTLNSLERDFEQAIDFLDCSVNELYTKNLVIENIGNVCVRYSWKQVDPYRNPSFPLKYSTQLIKRFFFPEKNDISLPGQITEIPFYFKSREPGVYQETWILTTDPAFSKDKFMKFSLQGSVRIQYQREEVSKIENYIKRCRLMTESCKLVEGLFTDSRLEKPIQYDSLFYHKDVFQHNNPDFFYESQIVAALQDMYENTTGDSKWDFNLTTLRNAVVNKNESVDDKRQRLTLFYELSNSLLKSEVDFEIDDEKYRAAYQILCSLANEIERDALHLRRVYRIGEFKSSSLVSMHSNNEQAITAEVGSVKSGSRRSRANSVLSKGRKSKSSGVRRQPSIVSQNSAVSEDLTKEMSGSVESIKTFEKVHTQYVKTFSIKTYQRLSTAIDEITAIIESFNIFSMPE